jgi:hypothetical protein
MWSLGVFELLIIAGVLALMIALPVGVIFIIYMASRNRSK